MTESRSTRQGLLARNQKALGLAHQVLLRVDHARDANSEAISRTLMASIPEPFLLEHLERSDVLMLADEFQHARDRGRHRGRSVLD